MLKLCACCLLVAGLCCCNCLPDPGKKHDVTSFNSTSVGKQLYELPDDIDRLDHAGRTITLMAGKGQRRCSGNLCCNSSYYCCSNLFCCKGSSRVPQKPC